jgi:hypothetical protein
MWWYDRSLRERKENSSERRGRVALKMVVFWDDASCRW